MFCVQQRWKHVLVHTESTAQSAGKWFIGQRRVILRFRLGLVCGSRPFIACVLLTHSAVGALR